MNILYLHSHDTGRSISPYGHAVPTPNLQAFAEQGVLFRRAFCAAPTCSPSRAALLTGRYPHQVGMLGLAHRGHRLNDHELHLASFLKKQGHHTALVGVHHLGAEGCYDEVLPFDSPWARDVAPAAEAWLADPARREKPFFFACGIAETHTPLPDATDDDARYVKPMGPLPDAPATRRDAARFAKSVRDLDTAMGRVLSALEAHGLAGNTLVIVTTDHGPPFPDMKCDLTDHGTGVMLMMRGPGMPAGRVIDSAVSHLDLFPTICQALGGTPPEGLEGKPLRGVIAGDTATLHDELFAEVTWHAGFEPKRSVRTERHLYIRRLNPDWRKPVLVNCDASESKSLWLDYGHASRELPEESLFDNVFDPQQRHDVAGDPRYADALDDCRRRLDDWMRRTDDPLLTDPVPIPRPLTYNPHTSTDPGEEVVPIEPGQPLRYPEG